MDSGSPTQKQRWRLRWWHPPLAVLLAILLSVGIVVVRFVNDWDLISVQERAAALGIGLDPEPPAIDDAGAALLDELVPPLSQRPPYTASHLNFVVGNTVDYPPPYLPHGPIPSSLPAYVAARDPDQRQHMWAIIDKLGDHDLPLTFSTLAEPSRSIHDIQLLERATQWMADEIIVADRATAPKLCLSALRFLNNCRHAGDFIAIYVDHCTDITLRFVNRRLPALTERPQSQRHTIAAACERLDRLLNNQTRTLYEHRLIRTYADLTTSETVLVPPASSTLPTPTEQAWLSYARIGRQTLLLDLLDEIEKMKRSSDPILTLHRMGDTPSRTLGQVGILRRIFEPSILLRCQLERLPRTTIAERALTLTGR